MIYGRKHTEGFTLTALMGGNSAPDAKVCLVKFDKLNDLIPYAKGGKPKVLTMQPYNGITLAMPGRHWDQTTPVGGDYVVMVDDYTKDWTKHQFTHDDIFRDIESKKNELPDEIDFLMRRYLDIVLNGDDPEKIDIGDDIVYKESIHPKTLCYALQCLAVAEHRRYARFESKFGGRYLPFRFAAGIAEGLWTASDAIGKQKFGRPGVEQLEKEYGKPILTKELMS